MIFVSPAHRVDESSGEKGFAECTAGLLMADLWGIFQNVSWVATQTHLYFAWSFIFWTLVVTEDHSQVNAPLLFFCSLDDQPNYGIKLILLLLKFSLLLYNFLIVESACLKYILKAK